MPHGYEPTRLRQQQKQHSIQNCERLIEEEIRRGTPVVSRQSAQERAERFEHPGGECAAHNYAVPGAPIDRKVEQSIGGRHCLRAADLP